MMRRLRPALLAVAALSAAIGAVLLALPPALGAVSDDAIPIDATPALPRIAAGNPSLAEDLVLANAFSPQRAPPASRYAPPDGAIDSPGGMLADSARVDARVASGEPRLLGTVVGARGRQALVQLDSYAGTPRLYAEGDRDGRYRIISIAPRAVVLSGPRGRVTLRLDPEEERP